MSSPNPSAPSPLMLSVSGCRGIVGSSLTADVAARFAASFGSWLRERAHAQGQSGVTVVIGRDGRAGGQMIQYAAIAGLVGAGCNVVDLGIAMTPTVAVMTDEYARRAQLRGEQTAVAGMVLTASHNPQIWNGLKCLLAEGHELPGAYLSAACAPPADCAGQIIERFKASTAGSSTPAKIGVPWDLIGSVTTATDAGDIHIDRLLAALQNAGLGSAHDHGAGGIGVGLRVALDSVNGSGAIIARDALEALGCDEILHLGKDTTGIFSHAPEPTADNLAVEGGLCDAVREGGLDVGFAQDPDADRLAIIDETGKYIGEEYTLALSAMAVLEAAKASGQTPHPGKSWTLVTNLSTSRMLDDVAATYGAKVLRTAVGEANVVAAMKRDASIVGGEGNGGTIWPRVTYVRDSLSSMALVLWLMSPAGAGKGTKRKLSDIVKAMPSYAIEKRKIDLARKEDAAPVLDKLAAAFKHERVDRQDGVWIDFASKRAWLHVRASNTEPIMRLIAEAPTKALANELLDHAMTMCR